MPTDRARQAITDFESFCRDHGLPDPTGQEISQMLHEEGFTALEINKATTKPAWFEKLCSGPLWRRYEFWRMIGRGPVRSFMQAIK